MNEGARLIQLRAGRHLIDLLPLAPGETASPSARMDHVCLSIRCDDLPGLAAWLRQEGVAVEGDVVQRRGAFGDGGSLYIRDLDGYRIELKPQGSLVAQRLDRIEPRRLARGVEAEEHADRGREAERHQRSTASDTTVRHSAK